ncbi:MAG: cytochrome c oxidase subunit II [Vicinamibacterales bacterium]
MAEWLGLPIVASPQAADVSGAVLLLHGFMLVVFVGWLVYFAYAVWRFRAHSRPPASRPVSAQLAVALVAVVTIYEIVELVAFALPAWNKRVDSVPDRDRATVVRVVAEQFTWNVHYPGADGRFGPTSADGVSPDNPLGVNWNDAASRDDLTTINQLNLPMGSPVLIELTSKDVIHSFTLAEMGVKQDAIPGRTSLVWFQPSRETPEEPSWEISCSQLCGLGHYRMRGFYRIMDPTAFTAWMEEERLLAGH